MARPKKTDANLSQQVILERALTLLEAGGVEAISFRHLAGQLGVTAMAVKHHVGSKEQLLQSLVGMAFQDIAIEVGVTSPKEALLLILKRYCQRVVQHSNLLHEILINPSLIDDQLSQLNALIMEQLQKAGIGEVRRPVVLGIIVDYTHGFAFSMAAHRQSSAPRHSSLSIDDYVQGLELLVNGVVTQSKQE